MVMGLLVARKNPFLKRSNTLLETTPFDEQLD